MAVAEIVGLFEALQLNGSYRGIGFACVDGADESGRRVSAFLFPGQDPTAFQDLGQLDGDFTINGIMVGDDYIHQAARLRAAFQTPGPATLVTPWWGTVQVEQAPGKAPKFSFKADQLRVATFSATVRLYVPNRPAPADTLQGVLDALADLRTAALGMLTRVLAPVALTLSAIASVERLAGEVAGTLGGLILAVSDPQVGIAGGLPIGLLSGIGGITPNERYGSAVGTLLMGPSAAIAGTTTPPIPSAVAPGGSTATPTPVDGRVTAGLLVSAAATLAPPAGAQSPIPALRAVMTAILLADALQAATDIAYTSQQEATAWRDKGAVALDAAAAQAAALVPTDALSAAPLWRGLTAARTAWIEDMSATIGRLPVVATFQPPAPAPVWALAYYLYGANPKRMLGGYLDIVARNGIANPGLPPVGPLEVLT